MGSDAGISSNVSKGPGHIAIDAQLNYQEHGQYVRRPDIRAALANPDNKYVDLMRSLFHVPEPVVRYVAYHWIPDDITQPHVWWRDKQPIEPLLRNSTIEAIDLAGDLPIDTYWMPIGSRNVDRRYVPDGIYNPADYPFEVIMTKSEHQLTRVFLTPPIPTNPNAREQYTEPSDIWVMRATRDASLLGDERIDRDAGVKVIRLYKQPSNMSDPSIDLDRSPGR